MIRASDVILYISALALILTVAWCGSRPAYSGSSHFQPSNLSPCWRMCV